MKVLSLFSGIGGFDLGFERAGMNVVGMCEIDKHAQKILTRHFPNATLHTDVKDVHYATGTIDVVCGGFPCQDLSVAGKRLGLAGNRSGLWFEFARIIDEAKPAWVVIENVQGLFSSNNGLDFAVIIDWLANRRYGVGWRMFDSQGFGLAQRRKRVFIVASLGNPNACTVLLDSESMRRNYQKSNKKQQNNSTSTEKRIGIHVSYALRATRCSSGDKGSGGINTTLIPINNVETVDAANNILWEAKGFDSCRISTDQNTTPTLSARMGTGGNNTPLIGIRRLTPTECERLQGFPDGWTDKQSDMQRYKQLGNAVSVPVAEWIGKRIMNKHNIKGVQHEFR